MNKCLNCGNDVKNKFCNVSCQNSFQNSEKANIRYGVLKDYNVVCKSCGCSFVVNERENLHLDNKTHYCSRGCANKRIHSTETKLRIRNSLTKHTLIKCGHCDKEFKPIRSTQKFCSKSCSGKSRAESDNNNFLSNCGKIGGKISVRSQNRRSKNEIFFAELCEEHFNDVQCNEQIFNGWDADVILNNEKIAILWNGNWHYKKITKKHSLLQVQNRDKIKISEISKFGYEPYVIKDLGAFSKIFVLSEFEILKRHIEMNHT